MADETASVRLRVRERRKFSAEIKKAAHDIKQLGNENEGAGHKALKFAKDLGLLEKTIGLAKGATMITALGIITQGLSAAGAGAVALTSTLGPLSGAVVAIPGFFLAGAMGMGVMKLATMGVTDALGGLHEKIDQKKLASLSTDARALVTELDKAKKPIISLQNATQKGLFPGLTQAVGLATPLIKTLEPVLNDTAQILGALAVRVALLFKSWQGNGVLRTSNLLLRDMGGVGLNLADALVSVLQAARPFLLWLSAGILAFSRWINFSAQAGVKTGGLARFFALAKKEMQLWWGIIQPFGAALMNIFGLGLDSGNKLLTMLGKSAEKFQAWTESAKGKNTIKDWFDGAMPAVIEIGRLIRDITRDFFKLGSSGDLAPLLKMLRTDLLPVLVDVISQTTKSFGPILIPALKNIALLFGDVAGTNGPLNILVGTIGKVAGVLHKMIGSNSGIKTMTSSMIGFMGIVSALGAASFMSSLLGVGRGFKVLGGIIKWLKAETILFRIQFALLWAQEKLVAFWTGVMTVATKVAAGAAKAWAVAQWLLNAAMSANPIMLAVIAIVALVAVFVLAYKKVGWFHDAVNAIWSFIKNNWKTIFVLLTGPIGAAVLFIVSHWDQIKKGASSLYSWVTTQLGRMVGFFKRLPDTISSATHGMFDGIKHAFKGVINWLIRAWNNLSFSIPSVNTHIKGIGKIGGFTLNTPDMPMLATGGVVTGSGAWITGEAGPELNFMDQLGRVTVRPLSKSADSPSVQPVDMSGIAGGVTGMPLQVHTKVYLDRRQIAEAVGDYFGDKVARA